MFICQSFPQRGELINRELSIKSGRRDSNPLPTAWEAVALPGELLPLNLNHAAGISAGSG